MQIIINRDNALRLDLLQNRYNRIRAQEGNIQPFKLEQYHNILSNIGTTIYVLLTSNN